MARGKLESGDVGGLRRRCGVRLVFGDAFLHKLVCPAMQMAQRRNACAR